MRKISYQKKQQLMNKRKEIDIEEESSDLTIHLQLLLNKARAYIATIHFGYLSHFAKYPDFFDKLSDSKIHGRRYLVKSGSLLKDIISKVCVERCGNNDIIISAINGESNTSKLIFQSVWAQKQLNKLIDIYPIELSGFRHAGNQDTKLECNLYTEAEIQKWEEVHREKLRHEIWCKDEDIEWILYNDYGAEYLVDYYFQKKYPTIFIKQNVPKFNDVSETYTIVSVLAIICLEFPLYLIDEDRFFSEIRKVFPMLVKNLTDMKQVKSLVYTVCWFGGYLYTARFILNTTNENYVFSFKSNEKHIGELKDLLKGRLRTLFSMVNPLNELYSDYLNIKLKTFKLLPSLDLNST